MALVVSGTRLAVLTGSSWQTPGVVHDHGTRLWDAPETHPPSSTAPVPKGAEARGEPRLRRHAHERLPVPWDVDATDPRPLLTSVADIVDRLALVTRPEKAAVWDPVGLQIGDPTARVDRVAVCHEVTQPVAHRVVEEGCDLVVAYHPLLFRPTSRIVDGPTPGGRAWTLARAGVSLVVTHTDFDAAPGGTAESLAAAIGLADGAPFGPLASPEQVKIVTFVTGDDTDDVVESMAAAGAGRIGNYDTCSYRLQGHGSFRAGEGTDPVTGRRGTLNLEPETRIEMVAPAWAKDRVLAALVAAHPYEEPAYDVYDVQSNSGFVGRVGAWSGGTLAALARTVSEEVGAVGLRVAGDVDAAVTRVAVVPGSGAAFIAAARRAGADAIVTGDVDHHRAVAAVDSGMAVVDPGHAATETPGMAALLAAVSGWDVDVVDLTGDGRGPWSPMPSDPLP